MKAPALRQRVVEQINTWNKEPVAVLDGGNLDLAVGRGAVTYGRARKGDAIRIRGGTARTYYIGVEQAAPAVPGLLPELHAMCVAPFGMEEGSEAELAGHEFALAVGEPVTFRFFMRQNPSQEPVGSVVLDWKESLEELPSIETQLDAAGDDRMVRVKLKSRVTELGTLEILCVSAGGEEWKLQFDLRAEGVVTV